MKATQSLSWLPCVSKLSTHPSPSQQLMIFDWHEESPEEMKEILGFGLRIAKDQPITFGDDGGNFHSK